MPRKLHLKYKGITSRTAQCYKREISRFYDYLENENLPLPNSHHDFDAILAEYINCTYQEGDSLTQAGWLLSGFKRFLPVLRYRLPTSQQYYNNWQRDHVPHRAVPMPWNVLKALVGAAISADHWDLAILLLLGFTFYLRTLEMIKLKREHLRINLTAGEVVVTLVQTKTSKQFAQSIVLRHRSLARFLDTALKEKPPRQFSTHQFRRCFSALLDFAHVSDRGFSLYSLRQGGATHMYARTRDLHHVAIQGRWRPCYGKNLLG